jgi:hypothetical protein
MTSISTSRGFLTVTDLNDFNGPAQTTNLVPASFCSAGTRATHLQHDTPNLLKSLARKWFPNLWLHQPFSDCNLARSENQNQNYINISIT